MGDEAVALAVVPHDLAVGTGPPLQHATLLPAPGPRAAQFNPPIAVGQIDHAKANLVLGPGLAVLKIDLHPQDAAVGRIELQFVVIAEPVVLRSPGQRPHRRQSAHISPPF